MTIRRQRAVRWLAMTAVGLAVLALGWWAGRVTMTAPQPSAGTSRTVVATVTERSVGRSLALNATVKQTFAQVATNALSGVVTSVDAAGEVEPGGVLYSVNRVPVRAVQGGVPFYRALSSGATGPDVVQLQETLIALGHLSGATTGTFNARTGAAVRAWERVLGVTADGYIELGELVAVPRLPAPLRLGEPITLGARVGGGEAAVLAPTGEIIFQLVVSAGQATLIPGDAVVTLTLGEERWRAVIETSTPQTDGSVAFTLAAPGGGPVCADTCSSLPAQEAVALRAEVIVVPEVTGPTIPAAAVRTDIDGGTFVVLVDGSRRDVTVRASANGVVVVDGLAAGDRVLVFGEA